MKPTDKTPHRRILRIANDKGSVVADGLLLPPHLQKLSPDTKAALKQANQISQGFQAMAMINAKIVPGQDGQGERLIVGIVPHIEAGDAPGLRAIATVLNTARDILVNLADTLDEQEKQAR